MDPDLSARLVPAPLAQPSSLALAAPGQSQPSGGNARASVPAAAVAALLVVATLVLLAVALRAVLRRRRGPPPLARVLLAGSLYEANLPRSRRHRCEG